MIGSNGNQQLNHDEVSNFLDARYVSAPEAMWRLLESKMHDRSHSITRLAIHLPLEQTVYFEDGDENTALDRAGDRKTTLTAWFELNATNESALKYVYTDIPYHFVFANGKWKERQRCQDKTISRMYSVSPRDSERFFLRLLLLHIPGATSFEQLRTVDGVELPTFKEAAIERRLVESDDEWEKCLDEAALFQMPKQMRETFALICAFCAPANALVLWDKFWIYMSEDFLRNDDD